MDFISNQDLGFTHPNLCVKIKLSLLDGLLGLLISTDTDCESDCGLWIII